MPALYLSLQENVNHHQPDCCSLIFIAVASKHSVSALINTSEHIKNPSSSFHGSVESLSRGLWLHLDSDPKSAAASGSRTLPLQRPWSFTCSRRASSLQVICKRNIFPEQKQGKKSHLNGMGGEVVYNDPVHFVEQTNWIAAFWGR